MRTLETNRLILRKFAKDDFDAVNSYASSDENTVYMSWGPNTEEQTRWFIDMAISKAEELPCLDFHYAAILKETGALVGACSLTQSGDGAEIGWILHRDYWKKGFAAEMGGALLELGFDELALHRIFARCDADNYGSYRVMEKLGLRKEGLFIEAKAASRKSNMAYGDVLEYALTRGEWDTRKEIAYYNQLPCHFDGFIELPVLSDGAIQLVCMTKNQAIPEKKWVPSYEFAVCVGSEKVGNISLRIGYEGGLNGENLYYGGQIGYNIDEKYRGNGYAGRACRLVWPVARAHGMVKLLITNAHTNTASRRVCEKLGARLVRVARVPEWHDLYNEGNRYENIFEWDMGV